MSHGRILFWSEDILKCGMEVTGCRLQVAGYRLQVTGCRLSLIPVASYTNYDLPYTGSGAVVSGKISCNLKPATCNLKLET
jgi:hypothetical protein